jgi:outer membrane receptor protein involved in Fe transport
MFHLMNGLAFKGRGVLDSLGVKHIPSFADQLYALYYPFNSTKPTRVWGFEVEHQANLHFLPGLLRNIVLSYNFSIVRSETYIPSVLIEEYEVQIPGFPFPTKKLRYLLEEHKQKLEGQPESFGNFALGYDIGGFSARISMFYQGEFNHTFSPNRRSDTIENSYTRWDLAVKQIITEKVSILLNVNNLTNVKEGTSIVNRVLSRTFVNENEIYGMTADLGIRIEL